MKILLISLISLELTIQAMSQLIPLYQFNPIEFNNCENCCYGPINYFNRTNKKMFIHVNGIIYFNDDGCSESPLENSSFISILHHVNTHVSGQVYFGEVHDRYRLLLITEKIRKGLKSKQFKATSAFSITWLNVGESNSFLKERNNFQFIYTTNNTNQFIIINYSKVYTKSINKIVSKVNKFYGSSFLITKYDHKNGSNINQSGFWMYEIRNFTNKLRIKFSNLLALILFCFIFE